MSEQGLGLGEGGRRFGNELEQEEKYLSGRPKPALRQRRSGRYDCTCSRRYVDLFASRAAAHRD